MYTIGDFKENGVEEKFTTEEISPVVMQGVHYLKGLGYSQEKLETMRDYLKLAGEYIDNAIELYNDFHDNAAKEVLTSVVQNLNAFDEGLYGPFKKRNFKKLSKINFCSACNILKKFNANNIEKIEKSIYDYERVEKQEFYNDMYSIFPDLKNGFASSKESMPTRTTDNGREGL